MLGQLQEPRKITGSVQLQRGKWHCVINLYNEEGKRKPKWITTGLLERGNKRRAEQILATHLERYNAPQSGAGCVKSEDLFHNHALLWLQEKRRCVELSTWENYANVIHNHVVPYFKEKSLALHEVKPRHIKEFYMHQFENGRKDHQKGGLSQGTLKKHASVLRLIFADAVDMEDIPRNPAERIRIPESNVENQRSYLDNAKFLNAEEANHMLVQFEGDFLQPLIFVTLNYGLRRSEVVGLKWDAVNLEEDTLTIKHTVVKHNTIVAKDRVKSKASYGVFSLLPEVKSILQKIKTRQDENRKRFGAAYEESDYIFTWPDGSLVRPDYVTKRFQKVLEESGLSHMRFHDLRHSCSSILYEKGWNVKDIQEWLRHSKLETTMNIYTHISELRKKILAKDMQGTFQMCSMGSLNKNQHPGRRHSSDQAKQKEEMLAADNC